MQNDDIVEYLMNEVLIDVSSYQVDDVELLKLFLWEVEDGAEKRLWN